VISGPEIVIPSDISVLLWGIMILNILIKVFKFDYIMLLQIMILRKGNESDDFGHSRCTKIFDTRIVELLDTVILYIWC
jgi:hypothetical protein